MTLNGFENAGMRRRVALQTMVALGIGSALGGCGGGEESASIRVVNAMTGQGAIDVYEENELLFAGVAAGDVSERKSVDGTSIELNVRLSGSGVNSLERELTLSEDDPTTAIIFGLETSIGVTTFAENEDEPDAGLGKVRLINTVQTGDALDLYLTRNIDDLSLQIPVLSGIARNATSAFRSLEAGTYRLRLTKSGDRTDVRLDAPNFVVNDGQVVTFIATPAQSGALVNGLSLVQNEEGAVRYTNDSARVRFVNATLENSPARPSIDGTPQPDVGGWGVSSYVVTRAGSRSLSFTLEGQSYSREVSLSPGSDITLALFLRAGSVTMVEIPDSNLPSGAADRFKMRLVNLADAGAAQLTYNSGSILADFTSSGESSQYGEGTGGTYDFKATAGSASQTLEDSYVAPSGVYSAFLFGQASLQRFVLTRDR